MRRSTAALLVLAAVPALLVVPTLGPSPATPHPVAPRLSTLALTGVDQVALAREDRAPAAADADVPPRTSPPVVFTAPTATADFSLVGVTWDSGQQVQPEDLTVTVRTHSSGQWQPWALLATHSDDGPSIDAEAPARVGTAPYFSGPSDGVQVRVDSAAGAPAGLRVDLVDPGSSDADTHLVATVPSSAEAATGMPDVITRSQWGADESLRNGSPTYEPNIKVAFVHHTASSNSYTKAQAASAVRAIYAYDTKSLGWSDIAYNVIVDKFGQVFEGRAGGLDENVRSAATGGFNAHSWAVSALGNYSTAQPTPAMLTSIEKVLAWRLGIAHLNPTGTAKLTAAGGAGTTAKYSDGTTVSFPVISGHRDAGSTACPGSNLYPKLPAIRGAVESMMGAGLYATRATPLLVDKGKTTPIRVRARALTDQSWRLELKKEGTGAVLRSYDGSVAAGGLIDVSWDLKGDDGNLVPAGVYTATLQSWNDASVAVPYAVNAGLFADPNVYNRPSDGVFRLQGRGYGHGHGMSQFGAEGAARKGLTRDQILAFYYPGTTLAKAPARQTIRVSLSNAVRTTPKGKDVRLPATTGLQVSHGSTTLVLPAKIGGKTITSWRTLQSDGLIGLYGWNGSKYVAVAGWTGQKGPFRFTTAPTASTTSRVTVTKTTGTKTVYRGVIEVRRTSTTNLGVVSQVLLDDYVKSVVSGEMPGGWSGTAYQAQAVAARSYALFKRAAAVAAGNKTHICDTTACQVYNGYSGETSPESKAATATAGLYLTYGGAPIFAEFGSADGGWTSDGGKPYLVAKADPYDGVLSGSANWGHAWTATVSAATLQRAYPAIGTVKRIVVQDRVGHGAWGGRATSVRVEGSKGSVDVSGTALRSALGLKSEWFRGQQVPPPAPAVVVPTAAPGKAPRAARSVAVTGGDRRATVTWKAPSTGSSPTGYRVTVRPGGKVLTVGATKRKATVTGLVNGRTYSVGVTAQNTFGSAKLVSAAVTPGSPFSYHVSVKPRMVWSGKLVDGQARVVKVLGVAGVPSSRVSMVEVRVRASATGRGGMLSVAANGSTPKYAQQTLATGTSSTNAYLVPVGAAGSISLRASTAASAVVTVTGYQTVLGAVGQRLVALTPAPLASASVSPSAPRRLAVAGHLGVPAKAPAVLAQVTVTAGSKATVVRFSPDGSTSAAQSLAAVPAGATRSVPVVVPLAADGSVRVLSDVAGARVSVDVHGYFVKDTGTAAAGRFRSLPVARLFASSAKKRPVPTAGAVLTVPVLGRGGVPSSGVSAVVLNVIAFRPTATGVLRVFPSGASRTATRSVSYAPGATVRTTVICKVGPDGKVVVAVPSGGTHVVVDVSGYVTG